MKKSTKLLSMLVASALFAGALAGCGGGDKKAADVEAPNFMKIVEPIVNLLNSLLRPLMAIVGAVGALYCVVLGVKYARAEEPQDREKAKQHLKNALIGFILIFGMIVVLNLLMNPMLDWVESTKLVNDAAKK